MHGKGVRQGFNEPISKCSGFLCTVLMLYCMPSKLLTHKYLKLFDERRLSGYTVTQISLFAELNIFFVWLMYLI